MAARAVVTPSYNKNGPVLPVVQPGSLDKALAEPWLAGPGHALAGDRLSSSQNIAGKDQTFHCDLPHTRVDAYKIGISAAAGASRDLLGRLLAVRFPTIPFVQ